MKIAFLGDSLTEGIPGVSYFNLLERACPVIEMLNYGKGGDTVASLHQRIQAIHDLDSFDRAVVFIGINDLFLQISSSLKIIKLLKRVKTSKTVQIFAARYRALLNNVTSQVEQVLVVPPLLIGENPASIWNSRLDSFVNAVKIICNEYPMVEYVPVRSKFIQYLQHRNTSNYISTKSIQIIRDVRHLKTDSLVDDTSLERGLYLTLDGVHLNSTGARLVAHELQKFLC